MKPKVQAGRQRATDQQLTTIDRNRTFPQLGTTNRVGDYGCRLPTSGWWCLKFYCFSWQWVCPPNLLQPGARWNQILEGWRLGVRARLVSKDGTLEFSLHVSNRVIIGYGTGHKVRWVSWYWDASAELEWGINGFVSLPICSVEWFLAAKEHIILIVAIVCVYVKNFI